MKKIFAAAVLYAALTAIAASEKTMPEVLPPQNIVIVLDLSNRLKAKGQADKDKAIIKGILNVFEKRQKRQGFITSKDKIQIIIAPQPDVPAVTNDKLAIKMGKSPQRNQKFVTYPEFAAKRQAFLDELNKVYKDAQQSAYTGADLYTFFCTTLPTQAADEKMANKVIVLTDGYLQFDKKYELKRSKCTYMRELEEMRKAKENWRKRFEERKLGLCACPASIRKTEVLLLETAPKNKGINPYEFYMIQHYWTNWFGRMGVDSNIYMQNDKIDDITEVVGNFLDD